MTSTTAPAPPRTPRRPDPPAPAGRRMRVPQLALGLVLSGLAALGFVLFNAASVQRTAALALAADVERGQVLEVDDLRIVHVGTDDLVAMTPATDSGVLVGKAVVADLAAGTLLTADHVSAGAALTPGAGVVGLALAPGQYPTPRLTVGDLVSVVEVSDGLVVLVEAAEVVGIEPVGTQGLQFISLHTGEAEAVSVAQAAATGEVRLVLVARDRGEGRS